MRCGGCGDRYPATIPPRSAGPSRHSLHGDGSDTVDGPDRRDRDAGLPACTWNTRLMVSEPDLSDSSQPEACPMLLDTGVQRPAPEDRPGRLVRARAPPIFVRRRYHSGGTAGIGSIVSKRAAVEPWPAPGRLTRTALSTPRCERSGPTATRPRPRGSCVLRPVSAAAASTTPSPASTTSSSGPSSATSRRRPPLTWRS
jgi:hypothetical protein